MSEFTHREDDGDAEIENLKGAPLSKGAALLLGLSLAGCALPRFSEEDALPVEQGGALTCFPN